ncbi:MAG: hypothetical protein NZ602_11140 [Thermoguttaceae bacterium]|nr:hypothetical protein [Thermoguttaceae bacterium]MDW8037230.1 hypothetical protein [Thermoguttaceae bacterium]
MRKFTSFISGCVALVFLGFCLPAAAGAELWVGAAAVDITPDKPVALQGQFHLRISKGVDNPLRAAAVALETRQADRPQDQALLISCDLTVITEELQQKLRDRLRQELADFDVRKLVLTATHTHTAPVLDPSWYEIPKQGVMQPSEYLDFLVDRLTQLASQAWKGRKPGGVSWGLGYAVVGHNRRAVYADGSAVMYGPTNRPDFQNFESGEDHGLEMLFFWDRENRPIAAAINVACPSQEVEGRTTINADFWHDVREQLEAKYKGLCVLGWPGAAGDQSPHLMYRKAADQRMQTLRKLSATQEIARRIVREVEEVLELTRQDIRTDVPMVHRVEDLLLPKRKVTPEEAAAAQAEVDALRRKPTPGPADHARKVWHQKVVERFQTQEKEPNLIMELHVIRLGDVAIVTNPFELFLDYGLRIKGRSKAMQTFVVQLSCGSAGYLPTKKAVAGGGYSAVVQSSQVGPEGGQILVDRSVEIINSLW